MIFLSHNSKDKEIVEPVAILLRKIFGPDQVFYDSWSIQPGDGIIERMNAGLTDCRAFVFFVSKNSLQSKMVDLEWQNAVMKGAGGKTKIIPVKIDDCMMPAILLQTLYIDMFTYGVDVGVRQLVDTLQGRSTFKPGPQEFQNLQAFLHLEGRDWVVEIRATRLMEPVSNFLFLVDNENEELKFNVETASMHSSGFHKDVQLDGGPKFNAMFLGVERATVPGFPFRVRISPTGEKDVNFKCVMHEKSAGNWRVIPPVPEEPPNAMGA